MIIDRLYEQAKANFGVCVGLDTSYDYLPKYLKNSDVSLCDKIYKFNKLLIDATSDLCACYKLQIAYYEAMGIEGMQAYSKTLKYLKQKSNIAIADIKRGDIAATAEQYAKAHFSGDFEADIVTLNAYMGEDAISPFYDYFREGKGAFVIIKTSNQSSSDLQDIRTESGTIYERKGIAVSKWGNEFIGQSGFSAVGAVAGLTYPHEFQTLRSLMPSTFFLIPGYGAQGGTGEDIGSFFKDGICGVVNSSRGIIASHVKKNINEGFEEEARKAVIAMREDIAVWL